MKFFENFDFQSTLLSKNVPNVCRLCSKYSNYQNSRDQDGTFFTSFLLVNKVLNKSKFSKNFINISCLHRFFSFFGKIQPILDTEKLL